MFAIAQRETIDASREVDAILFYHLEPMNNILSPSFYFMVRDR